jgi:uncharacterized OB-fold protein
MSESTAIAKPAPEPVTQLDEEFWEQCAQKRLCFQRCTSCDTWRHLPRSMCAQCGSTDWEWAESSGRGRVYSWSISHQAMHPAFADDVPYAVLIVELEEGVRMVSGLRGLPLDQLELGLPVEAFFEDDPDSPRVPWFRPVA